MLSWLLARRIGGARAARSGRAVPVLDLFTGNGREGPISVNARFLKGVIATGVLVRGGQVRCRRSRLGGSDALVDGDSFAQAGAGGGLVAGPRRAAGGAFER